MKTSQEKQQRQEQNLLKAVLDIYSIPRYAKLDEFLKDRNCVNASRTAGYLKSKQFISVEINNGKKRLVWMNPVRPNIKTVKKIIEDVRRIRTDTQRRSNAKKKQQSNQIKDEVLQNTQQPSNNSLQGAIDKLERDIKLLQTCLNNKKIALNELKKMM